MRRAMAVLIIIIAFAYAMPSEIEMASILAQPAIGTASSESTFKVNVVGLIFEGYPELIGRSYDVSIGKEKSAFLVHTDGYLLSDYFLANQSSDQLIIYENIQDQLLKDMGRIEHVREFGDLPTDEEINEYYIYSTEKYGGKDNLTQWLLGKYKDNSLSVNSYSQSFKFRNGDSEFPASYVDSYGNFVLLKAEGANFPTIVLSSANESNNGDTVYVIESGSEDSNPAILQLDSQGGVSTTTQSNGPSIIVNSNGKTIALTLSNTKSTLSFPELSSLLEKNGIINKNIKVNELYEEAIVAYFEGDYSSAKEKFEEVMVSYPYHTGAKKNLQLTEEQLSNTNSDILNIVSKMLKKVYTVSMELQLWIVLFALFALVIILIRGNKNKRK